MINDIVDIINNGFDSLYKDQLTLGIAQRVYKLNSDDSVEYMPGIVKPDGDAVYAGIDDIESLMIYHKTNSGQFSYGQNNESFGDGRINNDTFSLSVIAVWDYRKVKINNMEMAMLLRSRMPQAIQYDPIINIGINPGAVNLNSKQIFDSEYSLKETYLLPLFINFIQINYSIQLKYDPTCISKCIGC